MRRTTPLTIVVAVLLAFTFVRDANAGVIRYLGRTIKGNSQRVTTPIADTGRSVVAGTQTAGQKTAGAVGTGVQATQTAAGATAEGAKAVGKTAAAAPGQVANGAKEAPGVAAKGVKAGAGALWHAIY